MFFILIFIFLVPDLFGYIKTENYQVFNIHRDLDSTGYVSRVREVLNGHIFVETPLLYEEKDYSTMGVFTSLIYAMFSLPFLFLGFQNAIIIAKIILITINLIILYYMFLQLFKHRLYATFSTFVVSTKLLFSYEQITVIFVLMYKLLPNITTKILSLIGKDASNLILVEPVYFSQARFTPTPAFIFLSLSIIVYLFVWRKQVITKNESILYGVVWALLMYSYIYYALPFYFGIAFVISWLYITKNNKFYNFLKIVKITFIGLIPYFLSYIISMFTTSKDFLIRNAIEQGWFLRIFLKEYILWIITLILLFIYRKKFKNYWYMLITGCILSGFFTSNLQLFFISNPQPIHWAQVTGIFIQIVILMFMFLIYQKFNIVNILSIIGIAGVLILSFTWNYEYVKTDLNDGVLEFNLIEKQIYNYLNNNSQRNDVVVTDDLQLNYHLPIYTNVYIFMPQGFGTKISNKELLNRTYYNYKTLGYTSQQFRNIFKCEQRDLYDRRFNNNRYTKDLLNYLFQIHYYKPKTKWIVSRTLGEPMYINESDCRDIYIGYERIINKPIILPYKIDYIITTRDISTIPYFNYMIKNSIKIGEYNIYTIGERE